MLSKKKNRLLDILSEGYRPMRLFVFGGILLAYLTMTLLGNLFGIDTSLAGDIGFSTVVLIAFSILTGYGVSYGIMRLLENYKEQHAEIGSG